MREEREGEGVEWCENERKGEDRDRTKSILI
jgi:hypothetical protein